jgi:GNAT superfamily N-acetyltransferase
MTLLRIAHPDEDDALTHLTRRSKAHWGYDAAFMAMFDEELTITAEQIVNDRVTVLEEDGQRMGYTHLRREDQETVELVSLFIEPGVIRRGFGRVLWEDAVAWARAAGYRWLVLESDPHAEGFYRDLGASVSGTRESTVKPGRFLTVMTYDLASAQSTGE